MSKYENNFGEKNLDYIKNNFNKFIKEDFDENLKPLKKKLPKEISELLESFQVHQTVGSDGQLIRRLRGVSTKQIPAPIEPGYEGRIDNWRERFPEARIEHYRDGASGGISKAFDTKYSRVVGIKELKGSVEGLRLYTGEDQLRTIEDVFNVIGNSGIPGLMRVFGYYETERRGLKFPQLVFELLEHPSVLDVINGIKSEEEVRKFLIANGATLHQLHTSNGQPLFHRDVKPANMIVMPDDARYPFVMVDLGTLGVGTRETFYGTHAGTLRYAPHKQLAFGKMNKGAENFALIRSAMHYAIGKRFDDIDLDGFDISKLELNYSPELQRVFASATTQEESGWYGDFRKLMHDLGYQDRVPETKGELETILGHKSLPARVDSQQGQAGLPAVHENERLIVIDGKDYIREKSAYETLKNIAQGIQFDPETGSSLVDASYTGNHRNFLAYLNHLAESNYLVGEVSSGETTLGQIAREKIRLRTGGVIRDSSKRRADLCNLLGVEPEKDYLNVGFAVGSLGGMFASGAILPLASTQSMVAAFMMGLSGIGGYVGSRINRITLPNHQMKKRARELDSLIAHAKREVSGLEGKVGSVELTGEDKHKIKQIVYNAFEFMPVGISAGFFGSAMARGADLWTSVAGALTILGLDRSIRYLVKKNFERKALREKRLATGLDEDGMREVETVSVRLPTALLVPYLGKLKKDLKKMGMSKRLFRKEFSGESLKINYKHHGWGGVYDGTTSFRISATPEAEPRAREIAEELRRLQEVGVIKIPRKIGRGKIN